MVKSDIFQEPQIIGFFIEDDIIVVANPCSIPIESIEKAIKDHKVRKDKKNVTVVCQIMLPFKFPIKKVKKK
jgi:hypothetical protein